MVEKSDMTQRLHPEQISQELQQLDGWTLDADKTSICKLLKFDSFKTAMNFFVRAGELAEVLDHHPEFLSSYTSMKIRLMTHDAHGLTDKDFELAKQIDQLVNSAFSDLLKGD